MILCVDHDLYDTSLSTHAMCWFSVFRVEDDKFYVNYGHPHDKRWVDTWDSSPGEIAIEELWGEHLDELELPNYNFWINSNGERL